MFSNAELTEIKKYLKTVDRDSKIYLGADSQKYHKHGTWYAKYAMVIVIHINGRHGCKVFGCTKHERVYDPIKKPKMRLIGEATKIVNVYDQLLTEIDDFENFEIQIHLDLNNNPEFESNSVISQAMGYVLGMTGIVASIKPDAFAASYAADWHVRNI